MDKSNLPLPLKRQSLRDALSSTRMDRRTPIQSKHSVRDPGGKLGPSSRRVDRPQVPGDHLKRRTGQGSKKSNLPFSLNGSKVSDLCTVDTCVPVTPESVVPGKVRAGSTTLMKSKLLQLQERNRLIEARRRLDRDVTAMTSPSELKIDADEVTGNGSLPGCSAISPVYDELGPPLPERDSAAEGHTYQSIGELLRDGVSRPEVHQTGSSLPVKVAPDPGAKQVRSKSRSIFSKFWNLRRTQQALHKDTISSKPLAVSNTSNTASPAVNNKQLSQCSTEAVQKSISLGSSGNDDVTGNDREMSPDSIDDKFQFYARKSNTAGEDRIRSAFAHKSSASHRQNNSAEHSAILALESNRKPDAHEATLTLESNREPDEYCLSSCWNNQIISNKTRTSHKGNASENLCQISSTIGQPDIVGKILSSKPPDVQFDRLSANLTSFSSNFYGILPIAGLHESSSHNACFPAIGPTGFVIGKVAHRLRFSSPCCGVRMAEIRAVWRKCKVVALISDAVYSRHSLTTRKNNNNEDDFAWKLLREDASRLLIKDPNYISTPYSAQTVQGVAQDHESNSNGRLLSKRTTKDNEYFERISNQSQAEDYNKNSKRERNRTVEDFKFSEYYVGQNKADDSSATSGNSQGYNNYYGMNSPCKETRASESKLKQPQPVKYNPSVVQVAKVGLNNSARTDNSAATKLNLLHTKQQSKEENIYKNTSSDSMTSVISDESSDGEHQSQMKHAFVRHIETAATPVTPASVPQPERSFSSQPGDPEITTLKSELYIPRIRIKPTVQTTDDEQSTAVETSHSETHHANGFRSVECLQDKRNSYSDRLKAELVPCENVLESDLRDSGSPLLSRLLEASTSSSVMKEDRTEKEDGDEDEELELREIKSCASLSQSSDLSNSEPKSLWNSRYLEIGINEITADSSVVLPPQGVGPRANSGNKDGDNLENKRRRGKSQIVAPRTDASRCRQQIERIRLEATNHAKHEIHQNL